MAQIVSLLLVAWVSLVSAFWGDRILTRAEFFFDSLTERFAFAFCLGFGTIGLIIFAVGYCGGFHTLALYGSFLVLSLPVFFYSPRMLSLVRRVIARATWFTPYATALVILFLLAVVQALIPSTAHDALAYHLDIPKRFALAGCIYYVPYGVNSVFPLLLNQFYVLSVMWDGTRMANLFHLMTALGTVLGILAIEKRCLPRSWVGIASLVFWLTPGVFNQMTIAYNDIALTFFLFFSFFAAIRWSEHHEIRWAVLSGAFLGFALGVKYLAAFAAIAISLGLFLEWVSRRISLKSSVSALAVFALVAFLIGCVWYFRSYAYEGSFLYFGEKGYQAKKIQGMVPWLTPWFMTMDPAHFGGMWARVGVLYLAFLPGVFLIRNRPKTVNNLLFFSAIYLVLWLFLPRQNLRFLFPACALWVVPIGFCISRPELGKWASRFVRGLFFLALFLDLGAAFYHGRDGYGAALGLESEADYLSRVERSYPASRFVNANLPRKAIILNAYEVRGFYFDRVLIREPEFRAKTRYDTRFTTAADAIAFIKLQGVTHVLIAGPVDPKGALSDRNIRNLVRDTKYFKAIYRGVAPADPRYEYAIYAIL